MWYCMWHTIFTGVVFLQEAHTPSSDDIDYAELPYSRPGSVYQPVYTVPVYAASVSGYSAKSLPSADKKHLVWITAPPEKSSASAYN